MARDHHYAVTVEWTGNTGEGTGDYRAYRRDHEIKVAGKPLIAGSADPQFLGDGARWNPEDLLVAALSACHKLWYLHLCADAGITVESYVDHAEGTLRLGGEENRFSEVVLHPEVVIREASRTDSALALHEAAHHECFIARSMNFPVRCEPRIRVAGDPS
ncbi:OsmC family protein [Spiribacter halobius]|uniref:Peroxiredoxin n=1 Tax=Sediminicurvatus halobius TaxID=2182432 RepID=A0A2U2MWN6_9GAMM|nr:OsmC family protein [Spiribacter halobius]PWG61216.1 peroxiredoxin [Spiribacter halobius]UEX77955.1 OsmC family protein [Spiribacter halobius]